MHMQSLVLEKLVLDAIKTNHLYVVIDQNIVPNPPFMNFLIFWTGLMVYWSKSLTLLELILSQWCAFFLKAQSNLKLTPKTQIQ